MEVDWFQRRKLAKVLLPVRVNVGPILSSNMEKFPFVCGWPGEMIIIWVFFYELVYLHLFLWSLPPQCAHRLQVPKPLFIPSTGSKSKTACNMSCTVPTELVQALGVSCNLKLVHVLGLNLVLQNRCWVSIIFSTSLPYSCGG